MPVVMPAHIVVGRDLILVEDGCAAAMRCLGPGLKWLLQACSKMKRAKKVQMLETHDQACHGSCKHPLRAQT
eukprot:1151450-Pelagomonas_calceolata.AAC.3